MKKKMVPCGCKTCTCDLLSGAITLQSLCWLKSLMYSTSKLVAFAVQFSLLPFGYTISCTYSQLVEPFWLQFAAVFHVLILNLLSLFGYSLSQSFMYLFSNCQSLFGYSLSLW